MTLAALGSGSELSCTEVVSQAVSHLSCVLTLTGKTLLVPELNSCKAHKPKSKGCEVERLGNEDLIYQSTQEKGQGGQKCQPPVSPKCLQPLEFHWSFQFHFAPFP